MSDSNVAPTAPGGIMHLVIATSHDCSTGSEVTHILGVNAPVEERFRHTARRLAPNDPPVIVNDGNKSYKLYYLGARTYVLVELVSFWRRLFGQQPTSETCVDAPVYP